VFGTSPKKLPADDDDEDHARYLASKLYASLRRTAMAEPSSRQCPRRAATQDGMVSRAGPIA
jgi:hypothetical protein